MAVIDSGIDYDHPDLGGCFGRGCRVTNGYDLVGDDYDEDESDPTWQPVPHPDGNPDDCAGHGTHVAGIIGANGGIRGVAPDVTFSAYRVFGCTGATSTDVMLAAMERVYHDGADVLNMSIGEQRNGWPQGPTAQAASRLVRKGIVVVGAAGNDHIQGLYGAGGPGVGADAIDVASVDNLKRYALAFTISPDNHGVIYTGGNGSPPVPSSGTLSLARTGTVASTGDACDPLPASTDVRGKVALVRRGTCDFLTKATNVAAAGAAGMVVYSNDDTFFGTPFVPGIQIPVVYISRQDGELIDARLDAGPVSLTWGRDRRAPELDGRAGVRLLVRRPGRGSHAEARHRRAGWVHPVDLAAREGPLRGAQRHLHGIAARRRRGRALSAGASAHARPGRPRHLPEQRRPGARDRTAASSPSARQGAGLIDIDDAILATTRDRSRQALAGR